MPWIDWIDEDVADGELAEIYDRLKTPAGTMDHVLKIHSLNPKSLTRHYDLYRHLMFGRSGLSRAQREMIAVAVSVANSCRY